ncbi:thioredoxin family protein [Flavobacterium granuli]|uniref:Thioredoxin-like n=1 Tax=Flavobacterium granuli TaxID=280093 RepID=A0A1M5S8E2_9FLAO|nr:thioredoxin family protein [Flavobacterium granuli]PRZ21244.1 thioredoxin-like protein [Flavobacterium granuli]SHH34710.1 Thioredoxin-like [Flavobacterium granuli]
MKKTYSIVLLMVFPILLMAQGIKFEHGSFNEALKKAKAENKLLFIDGYAVWCGPCKKMATTVFLEKEVGQYFDKNLIALKVDVERGEGPALKRKYGITGLPGYVFIDGDGNVVYRFNSAMPTAKFMEEVKLAVSYAKDPNSVGRLAERYESKKNDEKFVRSYLDRLKESKSTNYTDVLEYYLNIQKSIDETSKEMVVLLADHSNEIVFGGKADKIIQNNLGSDAWKLYVRKDVREAFQKLKKNMIENTTDYAVAKKDTTLLELTIDRAIQSGVKVDEMQRKRIYTFYYLQAGEGSKYKALVHNDNDTYINSIDAKSLRNQYIEWKKNTNDGKIKGITPHADRISNEISYMTQNYARFAETDQDKKDIIRWMKVSYDIMPGNSTIMSSYANLLYLFSNNKAEAIAIKEEAYQIALNSDDKNADGIKTDIETMKAGKTIYLK